MILAPAGRPARAARRRAAAGALGLRARRVAARAAVAHWLRADERRLIGEWRVRSASHAIWPALALCVPGNIVPDFPLINKSFNLCYACSDK